MGCSHVVHCGILFNIKKLTKHDKVPTSMGTEGSADSLMEKKCSKTVYIQFFGAAFVQFHHDDM